MATKANMDGLDNVNTNNSVRIITFDKECPRCGNDALFKAAGHASNPLHQHNLYVESCPHCGFWSHTGFVHKNQTELIGHLKSLGFHERTCSDDDNYRAMTIEVQAAGAVVHIKQNGIIMYNRIGDGTSNLTAAFVEQILAHVNSQENIDSSQTYLSKWDRKNNRLEVICGELPNIPRNTPRHRAWENSLIRPYFDGIETERYEQFLGILMNDE